MPLTLPAMYVHRGRGHKRERAMWSRFRSWRERRQVLRELRVLDEADAGVVALDDNSPLQRAKLSLAAGDRNAAAHQWTEARRLHPKFVKTSPMALEILLGLQRYDEAEELMLEGSKHFRRDPYYARGFAEVAARRGDFAEAARRWENFRKAFVSSWEGYAFGASCLHQLGQLDEAEAMLQRAIVRFPKQINCQIERARLAESRKDWPEALRRWALVTEQHKHPGGVMGTSRALQQMGRLDEAEAALAAARMGHPLVYEIVVEQARLAQRRGDENAELDYWATALRRFPMVDHCYYAFAHRLGEMARFADADQVLRQAMQRFPDDVRPAVEFAAAAHARKDWQEAATRWEALRKAWPNHTDGYLRGAQALDAMDRRVESAELRAANARRSTS
jgi:tetratricopeptide (TPR) repeat protein